MAVCRFQPALLNKPPYFGIVEERGDKVVSQRKNKGLLTKGYQAHQKGIG
jgi:hypothetical protein